MRRLLALLGLLILIAAGGSLGAGCGGDGTDEGATQAAESGEGPDGEADGTAASSGASADTDQLSYAQLGRCGKRPRPPGFRCGEIQVPLERAAPELGETTVGFAVRRRTLARKPSRGAIFAVEGGPGYASTATAGAFRHLFGRLLRRHELVLVDLRGTGTSERLDCPDVQRSRAPDAIALAECARRLGPLFEAYRTQNAADDIDAVREALGLERIVLYGDSYGTFLGQSYAFRHGERLEALVLDSAYLADGEDPWYPSLIRTGNRALEKACNRDRSCPGNAGKRLERLTVHLRRNGYDVGALIEAIASAAYGPPASYLAVDQAGRKLLAGNPGPWRRLTRETRRVYPDLGRYVRAAELVFGCNDYPMIWSRDASEPRRRVELERAIRAYPDDAFEPFRPREVALGADVGYLECLTWPRPTELYEPPIPDDAEPPQAPVLVVSGELDDLTTPHEGRQVAELFPNSRHYVARNAGHVDALYYTDGAAARRVRGFLTEVLRSG